MGRILIVWGILLVIAGSGIFWFVWQYRKEKRSLWLGISFLAGLLSVLALGGFLLIPISDTRFVWFILLLGSILFVGWILLFPVVLIGTMIISGINLIRKEGGGLSHILSLGFGILYIAYLIIWPMLNGVFQTGFWDFIYVYLSFCFSFTLFIFALYTITNLLNLLKNPRKSYQYIIVLGSGLKNGKEVTPLLASRVDKGIQAYQENKGSKLILSGGKGADEKIAEGEAMKQYAIQQSVPEAAIIVEHQSATTRENLLFSKKLIDQEGTNGNILVVTNRYHLLRALLLAKNLGIDCDGRGAKTKLYFSINAFVREWIAYLVLWRKQYLKVLAGGFVLIGMGYLLQLFLSR